jgi:hypothetical protein
MNISAHLHILGVHLIEQEFESVEVRFKILLACLLSHFRNLKQFGLKISSRIRLGIEFFCLLFRFTRLCLLLVELF